MLSVLTLLMCSIIQGLGPVNLAHPASSTILKMMVDPWLMCHSIVTDTHCDRQVLLFLIPSSSICELSGFLRRIVKLPYVLLLWQGEKECSYYLKTGQCKFGITCKFHHPQLAGISTPSARPFYQTVQSSSIPSPHQYRGPLTSYRIGRPPILAGSCAPGAYGPLLLPPGVVPIPGWSTYSVCWISFIVIFFKMLQLFLCYCVCTKHRHL